MKKRVFSILTALCLCLTLLPTTVFAESGTEESSACTCETACTAESMNTDCPVCGSEDALPENCGKYAAPVNGEESVTGTSAQALTNAAITFPAPQAGDKIIEKIGKATASGLTFSSTGHGLWKNGKITGLGSDAVYEEGSTYLLEFRFYRETPLTELETVTCNGQPVSLFTDDTALDTALGEYDGASDAYYAYTTVMDFSTGGTTIENAGLLYLFAFVHIPKVLTTVEVSTADALRTAIETGTDDIVQLTSDITISESLTINRTVMLDLNDHVLTIPGENQFITVSGQNTTLTLTDSAETKTERKFSINRDGAWVPDENGDETVTGGVITGGKTGADLYGTPAVNSGVCIENLGTLTVTDGTVNAPIRNISGTIAGSGTFNGTVINEDKLTGGTFNGPVANYKGYMQGDNEISGGIFYGTVANGYNYIDPDKGELRLDGRGGGLIAGGTFYGKVTNAFQSKITGGSFYGEVDNRDRSEYLSIYLGILAGGTFYAGHPGTVADGCCTVTYEYPFDETYAIQIVKKGETATRPANPVRSDFTFDNWYAYPYPNRPTQEAYDFDTRVEDDMFLWGNWANTFYGIHITDKNGDVYNITDKNANDVLGNSSHAVVYTPGSIDSNKKFTPDDWDKALRGETVEGLQLPKLTLKNADLQQIKMESIWISDPDMELLSAMLQLELVGDNTITCDGDSARAIRARTLLITGTGSLNATATGKKAIAIAVDSMGGGYYQYGGDVTLYGEYSGIYCTGAVFEFADGKLTVRSSESALYCELTDLYFKITSDTTTFFCEISENNTFEIQKPFDSENIHRQLKEKQCYFVPVPENETIHYAQLTANYTVTFDTDGGSAVDAQNVAYGGNATLPAAPTKSGYTFAGWYLGEETYNFTTAVTENLTLTAQWTVNQYTITYDLDGGTAEGNPGTYTAETDSFTLKNPTRPGYTFIGWSGTGLTGENNMTVTIEKGSTGDRSYTAHWRYNGGSSGGSSSYPITVPDKTENGSVTVSPKNASRGSTVTITVKSDSGYVLETISVTDKNGNDLKLTDKGNGKYTFTMPGSKVEVKVTFMEDNSVLNFFYDVPNDAYYYEAVKWAAENGITGGIGNSLFAPNQPCTRAQIVTFLWRAAGSPVVNYLMPFTDVDEGAYYAEAVRWAASTGIVTGLTETTFGTDSVCTRAQAAAMIYRCAQAQGKGFTGAWMFHLPFTDVPEWAYESVAWCYMNGVTTGVSETAFAPGNDCTRAQIVTFLYRAYQGN